MGFKTDWQSLSARKIDEYVGIVRDAFENAYGVGILRNSGCERLGFDMFTSHGQNGQNERNEITSFSSFKRTRNKGYDQDHFQKNIQELGAEHLITQHQSLRRAKTVATTLSSVSETVIEYSEEDQLSPLPPPGFTFFGTNEKAVGKFMVRAVCGAGGVDRRMSTALAVTAPIGTTHSSDASRISKLFGIPKDTKTSEPKENTETLTTGSTNNETQKSHSRHQSSMSTTSGQTMTTCLSREGPSSRAASGGTNNSADNTFFDSIVQRIRLGRLKRELAAVTEASSKLESTPSLDGTGTEAPIPTRQKQRRIDVWWLYDDG